MKLINQISYRYILVSAIIILFSIPLLYFIIEKAMLHSLDESMVQIKTWIAKKLPTTSPENFVSFNNNIAIVPSTHIPLKDSFFYEDVVMPGDDETVPHRVLISGISVHNKTYRIRIQKSIIESEDLVQLVLWLMVSILTALLTGLFFINRSLSKKIWQPFYQTLDMLGDFTLDKQPLLQLERSNISEFNELNQTLEQLANKNHQIFLAQKAFTENAAHELQTPLAIIQSNVDLLLQKKNIERDEAVIIDNIVRANQRMARLNKSLLLLSKIENAQFKKIQPIDLSALIDKYYKQFEEAISQKNLDANYDVKAPFIVSTDIVLAEILISNLLSNSIRHNIQNGQIQITVDSSKIIISNTALSGAIDTNRLFRRFQRQSNNSESTGLGLNICQTICEEAQLVLSYSFIRDKHIFTLAKS